MLALACRVAAADLSRELLSCDTSPLLGINGAEGSRSLVAIVRDATPALSEEAAAASGSTEALQASMAGASGVLLHISRGDDPQSAHHRLRALLSCMGAGVRVRLVQHLVLQEIPHCVESSMEGICMTRCAMHACRCRCCCCPPALC